MVAGGGQRDESAQTAHRVVIRCLAGDRQAQGNQRLVGGPRAHRFEGAVERKRAFVANALPQCRRDGLGFRRPPIEEIPVDGMELHVMQSAARRAAAPVAATLMAGFAAAALAADAPAGMIGAAAGHPAGRHLHAEISRVRDGQTVVSSLDVDGLNRLERECAADLCHGTWFDGARSFAFGINGAVLHDRDSDDPTTKTFAAIASTAFAEPGFAAAGGRVAPLPDRGDGRLRFRVNAPGGAELIAVAAARTGRLTGAERRDGTSYATLIASGSAPGLIYGSQAYDRVVVVDEPLRGPAGPPIQIGEGREINLLPGPLPIVPCRLAGRAAACLIDSGSTPSAVTLAFAEALDREPRGSIEVSGLDSYLTGVVDAGPLEIGAADIASLHFAVIPHVRAAGFDVILGSDALAGLRVEFDPGRRRARIEAGRKAPAGPPIPVDFKAGLPFADVRLGGRTQPESMLVDTGDSETLSIGYDEYRVDMGLFAASGHSVARGAGAASMDTVDGELGSVEVGAARFEHVPIAAVRGQHVGHLGFGFAARCGRFVLALGEGRIECLGSAEGPARPAERQNSTRF